jgi:hypothetical protein
MSRKNVLAPVLIASNQSLASSFNSSPTIINYLDNCAYQINVNTSNSTGTFAVQASLDYSPGGPNEPIANAGNWVSLSMSGVPTVSAASDVININLNQLPFKAIRLAYTSTIAGTGTCNIYVMAKMI